MSRQYHCICMLGLWFWSFLAIIHQYMYISLAIPIRIRRELALPCSLISAYIGETLFFLSVHTDIPEFDSGTGDLQCSGSDPITCTIMTGANGTLQCSATGSPNPDVNFNINATTSNNIQFMNNRFTITSAVAENAGTYSCNASNSVGSDVRTYRLFVRGKT